MDFHLFKFFRSQTSGLGNNVLRYRQFADIVQQRGGPQSFQLLRRQVQLLGDFHSVDAHPAKVIMGGLVFGFNGQGQRFDGAQVQPGHVFYVAFFIFKLAEIKTVGTVNHEHGRQREQACLPADDAVHPAHQPGNGCAHQVIRE